MLFKGLPNLIMGKIVFDGEGEYRTKDEDEINFLRGHKLFKSMFRAIYNEKKYNELNNEIDEDDIDAEDKNEKRAKYLKKEYDSLMLKINDELHTIAEGYGYSGKRMNKSQYAEWIIKHKEREFDNDNK